MKTRIPANTVLAKLQRQYGAKLERWDQRADWFRVTAITGAGDNDAIYKNLKQDWRSIAGIQWKLCALLYAHNGRHAGVWVHIWPANEDRFEPGPDEVLSLD